ncbi:hypothetical protein OIDMADRAFT_175608 [Oidiodendron maius Zn]|uniref:DUF3224 domain-containing protein n=1 Tax=Oidiodendron maius (strain Zn) TaxID=913774 RepID=A0A0C3I3H5_OIDMZ|nr:hypothetical protein OIDMADRAFT_175608 [Oidiodendron maius Zn]
MTTVTVLVSHTKWDEDRSVTTTPRVTPAHVSFTAPDIDATIQTEYLMTYLPNGNAEFIFTDVVEAKNFSGHQGSFIAQGKGTFDGKAFTVGGSFDIVEGSGTCGLEHIKGKGKVNSAKDDPHKVTYEFVVEGI